jgi:hypothetical protein
MTLSTHSHWLRKASALLGLWVVALSFLPLAFADDAKDNLVKDMTAQQDEVSYSYDQLSLKVDKLDPNDPRKNPPTGKDGKPLCAGVAPLLDKAKAAQEAFGNLKPDSNVTQDPSTNTYVPNQAFLDAQSAAIGAINDVNRFLIAPVQPGAEKLCMAGTVPSGDLVNDFIPQMIRLMFRFTSLAILVSFVVSGVLFIIAFDNTEYTDKAKRMLYYSIIGFAFVTLAYAIVKGITQVNYFGVI